MGRCDTPGGYISIVAEPPGRYPKRLGLILAKYQQFARKSLAPLFFIYRQQSNTTLVIFFLAFVLLNHIWEVQGVMGKKMTGLTLYEEEHVTLTLSKHVILGPYAKSYKAMSLNEIAVKGENIGGTDSLTTPPSSLRQYQVASGDTLSGIAQKFGLHSGSIVLVNPELGNTELLLVGETLNVPDADASPEELEKERVARQKRLAAETKITPRLPTTKAVKASQKVTSRFLVPVSYNYKSQGFSRRHPGIDFAGSMGSSVRATKEGCIASISKGWNGGYGNLVILEHNGDISSRYAHLSGFAGIKEGGCVEAGDVIGYLGSTGRSTGPHLHFELRYKGSAFDPQM